MLPTLTYASPSALKFARVSETVVLSVASTIDSDVVPISDFMSNTVPVSPVRTRVSFSASETAVVELRSETFTNIPNEPSAACAGVVDPYLVKVIDGRASATTV